MFHLFTLFYFFFSFIFIRKDGNDNPICKTEKETQMYRTDFWTLWEMRVGCFKRTACILSIVKQITSLGGMHETSVRAWCTGKTQRNRVEREVGWGIHVTPWLIHVNV